MSLTEMDAVPGRIRYIWERMYTWIDTIMKSYDYETYQIEGDDFDVTKTKNYPLITIGVDDSQHRDETFGRDVESSEGVMVYYPFTMYVWDYHTEDPGYPKYHDLHILGDRITDYLKNIKRSSTEKDTHRIYGVFDIDSEESQPRNIRRVGRIIVTGRIRAKRLDTV